MICKNCGAEYDENLTQCPYCNGENTAKTYQEHYDYIHDLKKRTQEMRNLPHKIANASTSIFVKGILVVVVMSILALVLGFIWAKVSGMYGLVKQEKDLEKLEQLYQAGSYEEMLDYYYDCDSRGGSFEKYYRVGHVYNSYEWATSDLENLKRNIKLVKDGTFEAERIDFDVQYCMLHALEAMAEIAVYREEGYLYGEEDALEGMHEGLLEILEKELSLTTEEIKELQKDYLQYGEKCLDENRIVTIRERLLGE